MIKMTISIPQLWYRQLEKKNLLFISAQTLAETNENELRLFLNKLKVKTTKAGIIVTR